MANCRTDGAEAQHKRLERLLNDPDTYFDDARRQAHEQARKRLNARLRTRGGTSYERP